MRLVQVLIPDGTRESVLDEEKIDYVVWEETGRGDFEAVLSFPVPESGVEPMLERLEAAGIRDDAYTIVIATEAVVSERIRVLEERFTGHRISREELIAPSLIKRNTREVAILLGDKGYDDRKIRTLAREESVRPLVNHRTK